MEIGSYFERESQFSLRVALGRLTKLYWKVTYQRWASPTITGVFFVKRTKLGVYGNIGVRSERWDGVGWKRNVRMVNMIKHIL